MRTFLVKINGKEYNVEVEETGAQTAAVPTPVPAAPAAPAAPAPVKAAAPGAGAAEKAPIPGSVLKIVKNVGDSVRRGETVLLLEAMKMENEIHASSDGKVTSMLVSVGQSVNTGDPLFTVG